ncbi:Wadjet anti-phage system protein JetD domain-containing protein [Nonomuraea sp. NPDC050478]|uniref:Wadjet anti-phage system protein JetD domain-containing protein n=1 Tax=Nonomuraea sp. NPDC050478 TaxID=3364365 RepID=UPI003792E816
MTWTTPDDVRALLMKRWSSGKYLTSLATGEPWQPIDVPIRGPRPSELAARFEQVRTWVAQWEKQTRLRVEYKQVGGRTIGANSIPARAWIDDQDTLWALLKTSGDVRAFRTLHADAAGSPQIAAWMAANPMKVLALADTWPSIMATVHWIDQHAHPGVYLRHIDVPGVDTKFIERHKGALTALLDARLDPSRVRDDLPRSDFEGRYGFRKKPQQVRFRLLDGAHLAGFTDLTVRAEEFTTRPASVTTVYVVENEASYLAFPAVPGGMAVFGSGYSVGVLESLPWLADTALIYWGDIDTHGFAILDRLRGRYPHVISMLMDRDTLMDHQAHWAREPSQVTQPLAHLTAAEASLWHELRAHSHGPSIRLEQERIRFSAISEKIQASAGFAGAAQGVMNGE